MVVGLIVDMFFFVGRGGKKYRQIFVGVAQPCLQSCVRGSEIHFATLAAMRFSFLGNTLQEWATALTVMVAAAVVLYLVKCLAVRRLAVIAERTTTPVDDWLGGMLRATWLLTIIIGAAWIGSQMLDLPHKQLTWMWRVTA